jgi:hypothetical protein
VAFTNVSLAIAYTAILSSPPATPEPIPVGLLLEVELSDTTVEHLCHEVEQIFSAAGVRFAWGFEDRNALIHIVLQAKPPYPVITGCTRNLHDHRLGYMRLRSRRITLWTQQVARGAAGDWDSRKPPSLPHTMLGRALGRVLAHELGHLFMGGREHRRRGLMRASFKHRDLSARNRRGMGLSEEDIERIRAGARALLGSASQEQD